MFVFLWLYFSNYTYQRLKVSLLTSLTFDIELEVKFKVNVCQIYWLNLKINFGYICIVIVCNTILSTHFYILRTSVKQNWRITIMLPWAFREIQDGRHSLVKNQFWIISPIVTNDTWFPANLGSRNSFLNLFCQSEVHIKVKGQV